MPITSLTPDEFVQLLKVNGFEPFRDGQWRTADAASDWLRSKRILTATAAAAGAAEPPKQAMRLVPKEWLDGARPLRIVTHWTAGAYAVSALDKEHYHFIIDGDHKVFPGDHTVKDNENTADDDYAAHTRGLNTGSIGVAVACMAGAVERPFKEGRYPMRKEQWLTMAQVCAELCLHYGIEVTPRTVLGHGEVQATLGKPQAGKWDPMVLPWMPGLPQAKVGDMFRAEVARFLKELS